MTTKLIDAINSERWATTPSVNNPLVMNAVTACCHNQGLDRIAEVAKSTLFPVPSLPKTWIDVDGLHVRIEFSGGWNTEVLIGAGDLVKAVKDVKAKSAELNWERQ